jgi:hypothetical protein
MATDDELAAQAALAAKLTAELDVVDDSRN